MPRKCDEFKICPLAIDVTCKCSDCPNMYDCILCFKFGCINHVAEEVKE